MQTQLLTLMSCNIQAGVSTARYRDYITRGWSNVLPHGKRASLDQIAELARSADLVGLQESDPGSLRSGFMNQTHYIAERSGLPYWHHQPNRRVGSIASSANGLLSRWPLREVFDHPLPGRLPGRGVLLARLGDDEAALHVAVAHLSLGRPSRIAQLAFLAELLSGIPHVVLMGDFNCPPDTPEMEVLYRRTRLRPPAVSVPTFPSWKPQRALDHILTSLPLATNGVEAVPAARSDHLAVLLRVEVPAAALATTGVQ